MDSFNVGQSLLSLGTKATIKLGPNEKRAIAVINDIYRQDFASESEKELLLEAKKAIEIGRFQKLPREINTFKKDSISKKFTRITEYNEIMKIIKSYPLEEIKEEVYESEVPKMIINPLSRPQIIISESFSS